MNKIIAILFSFLFFYAGTCQKVDDGKRIIKGEDYITEGWLDENTFQVRTLGAPNPAAKGLVRRKTQAQEAALLAAQKRVLELMLGAKISGACGSDSGESTGCAIVKEFEGNVKGGYIKKTTFDPQDNCEIVFRVEAADLKKKAETAVNKIEQ